jgi:hypothetical protein
MRVVPAFAQAEQAAEPVVSRVVVGLIFLASEDVADRVDRPGDVVRHEDPHQAAPDQAEERALPRPRDEAADERRHAEADDHPQVVQPVAGDEGRIGQ